MVDACEGHVSMDILIGVPLAVLCVFYISARHSRFSYGQWRGTGTSWVHFICVEDGSEKDVDGLYSNCKRKVKSPPPGSFSHSPVLKSIPTRFLA